MEKQRRSFVLVANLTPGCAGGISDFHWTADIVAASENEAAEIAVKLAIKANRDCGFPPNGIKLTEDEIRRHLVVLENELTA